MEAPEQPHAHTGHRWLDIILAVCAMFVSVVSLVVAIGDGRTMERMADANTRMVQASSWPFVAFTTHNVDEHGNGDVRLTLINQGIGPARIQTLEMWYAGQPVASWKDLIRKCCQNNPTEVAQWQSPNTIPSVGLAAPSILRAGDHSDFFSVPLSKKNPDFWKKLNNERDKIKVRVCYCSVFDECFAGSGQTTDATRVSSCPAPDVPFRVEQ